MVIAGAGKFNDLVEEYLVGTFYSPRDRTNNRHWPSEASCAIDDGTIVGKCLREQYFARKEYPANRTIPARNVRKMNTGKAIEQNEIEYAKKMGIYIDDDVAFLLNLGDITISGKVDAIYKNRNGGEVCVEYKTSTGYYYEVEVYGKYGKLRAQPKPEHILQVILYLEAFKHIPYAIIFYINRDKMDVIEHVIRMEDGRAVVNEEVSEYTMDSICNRYRKLTRYLNSDIIPPCDFYPEYPPDQVEQLFKDGKISKKAFNSWLDNNILPGHWRCNYFCDYKDTCREVRDEHPSDVASTYDRNNRSGAIVEL